MQKLKLKKKKKMKKIVLLSEGDIRDMLLKLFKRHIGREKMIFRGDIFKYIWGDFENYSELQIWWLWRRIYRGLNQLRKSSHAFIVPNKDKYGRWGYYVVKNRGDETFYKELLKNNIRRMKWMMRRCDEAIEKKFYRKYLEEK